MLNVRLLPLVIFAALIGSRANGMRCVHGHLHQKIHGEQSNHEARPEATREMIDKGWGFLVNDDEAKLLAWCKELVALGINPSDYFGTGPKAYDHGVPVDLLVGAAIYNMPKVLEYLLEVHSSGVDCGFFRVLFIQSGCSVGDFAWILAAKRGHDECVCVLSEAIKQNIQQKAKL